jgi:hypothetical protein
VLCIRVATCSYGCTCCTCGCAAPTACCMGQGILAGFLLGAGLGSICPRGQHMLCWPYLQAWPGFLRLSLRGIAFPDCYLPYAGLHGWAVLGFLGHLPANMLAATTHLSAASNQQRVSLLSKLENHNFMHNAFVWLATVLCKQSLVLQSAGHRLSGLLGPDC